MSRLRRNRLRHRTIEPMNNRCMHGAHDKISFNIPGSLRRQPAMNHYE